MVNSGPRWRRCVQCGRLVLVVQTDRGDYPATIQTVACHCANQEDEANLTPAQQLERCGISAAADAVARRLLASVFPHGLPG